ncbi:MAG TPA: hypothetical protein VKP58_11600 [Candidatus Acidoferrum sp.]|nr:hypothetical protein [Candidatus Acidoferrum sp.]
MTLFDKPAEPQGKSNSLKYTLIAVALAALIGGYFTFRNYPEKRAVTHFFDALIAGNTEQAYELWQPLSSYRKGDFLADWGNDGYYGPIKSYEIMDTMRCKNSNGVVVNVAISPFAPMPDPSDAVKSRRTKVVSIFVDSRKALTAYSCSE